MKTTLATLGVLILGLVAFGGPVKDDVVAPAVIVDTEHGYGTGTVLELDKKVYILTAAHVVSDVMEVQRFKIDEAGKIEMPPMRSVNIYDKVSGVFSPRKARVVLYDAKVDLALLAPESPDGLLPASIAGEGIVLEPGEDVWYCGTGGGLPWNLQKSIVNQSDDDWLTVNGGGWYGHSGSGVFVKRGGTHFLVGVLVQFQNFKNPKSPMECVSLKKIRKFLGDRP